MLGRQQIAGLPTAISELFKNAHDAYASNVVVDFYQHDRLFVLRDDGLGMTPEEFLERWLTIGTESKLIEDSSVAPPPIDPDQTQRPLLGEKGIGRLAIAMLGPHLVVLTRAKAISGMSRGRKLSAAFINWDAFQLPGIDLDEIEIPVIEKDRGQLPSGNDVKGLVESSIANLRTIGKNLPKEKIDSLVRSASEFDVDPEKIARFLPNGPILNGSDGHGTQFLIHPVDAILDADLEANDDETASPLEKILIGFTDTMSPSYVPPIKAEFREHSEEGDVDEKIGPSVFFEPTDFERADHRFTGRFDNHGQFTGKVRIYNERPQRYVASWPTGALRETKCGPFDIDFAYVQGHQSESRLDPLEFTALSRKLKRAGGLYIYRDGIRVLPYGNTEFDFLDIEIRRSKGAGYYVFSYRRMFGGIRITIAENGNLQEKAGREGFRQNAAYRDFKALLENFLVQLAADFFRPKGASSEAFLKGKEELGRKEKLRRAREHQSKAIRAQLLAQLSEFFTDLEEGRPSAEAESIRNEVSQAFSDARRKGRLTRDDAGMLFSLAARKVNDLRAAYRVDRPRGVGLPRELDDRVATYIEEYENLERSVFTPLLSDLEQDIASILKSSPNSGTTEEILRLTYEAERKLSQSRLSDAASEARSEAAQLATRVESQVSSTIHEVSVLLDHFFGQINASLNGMESTDKLRRAWDSLVSQEIQPRIGHLESLAAEIRSAALTGVPTSLEVTEALEEELVGLRESQLAQFELLQLGIAIGIIQHEFRGCVKSLRSSLSKLKRWADANPRLGNLYSDIRTNFDHLDGYLSLFTPLTRRLYRSKVDISESEIEKFILELFGERFKRHDIDLQVTEGFKDVKMREYPSSVYPCFVNLVDNSVYWLSSSSKKRFIRFDAVDGDIVISDTGSGVKSADADRIFDLGFTRKPGGRGMGLYISRETLKKIGYDLLLDTPRRGEGATFRIRRRSELDSDK
jgi:signal transduction histidine kinase